MTRSLAGLLEQHAAATREFIAVTAGIPETTWSVPRAPGKWSPAEETEHMTLAQEVFAAQLGGSPPMAIVVSGWRRVALRWIVLPWILRTGWFPPRARSPREVRPSSTLHPQGVLARRLEAAAVAIRRDLERRGPSASTDLLDHPYFGPVSTTQLLRLTTVHTRHHLARLARASSGRR